MKKIAVLVSSGTRNNLGQVASLVMAAVLCDVSVSVLFRDEAAAAVTRGRIGSLPLSPFFAADAGYAGRAEQAKMSDVAALFREAKEEGEVKLFACTSSMFLAGVSREDLIPEIDEARGLVSFMIEEMEDADQVLTF